MEDVSTAHDIVNKSTAFDLAQILRRFGDERYYLRLAEAIVKAREHTMINTTGELKEVIRDTFRQTT